MTSTKISVSDILKSERYAIKIESIEQILKLIPDYKFIDDMELFFSTDPYHTEYIGTRHSVKKGFHLCFVHKEDKTIIDFEDLEIDK